MGTQNSTRGYAVCGQFICYCYILGRQIACIQRGSLFEAKRLQGLVEEITEQNACDPAGLAVTIFSGRRVR